MLVVAVLLLCAGGGFLFIGWRISPIGGPAAKKQMQNKKQNKKRKTIKFSILLTSEEPLCLREKPGNDQGYTPMSE